ncbi:MAG: hypothetical protein K0S76_430 [Herbinix sp.]|jgi:hypothetical protein|nr:hypothetical protein [Herbinix sp.]
MRYLKPTGTPITINEKTYNILYTLDVIDELQEKTNMPMGAIIESLTKKKTMKTAVMCLLKYITGEVIETDNVEYYSMMLLSAYIEQIKYKNMPKVIASGEEVEHEFIDVEYWFNIGKTILGYNTEEVWGMTLGQLRTHKREYDIYKGFIKEDKEVNIDDVVPY